jgi:UrcA family protein
METKMIKVLDAVSAIGALVMAATPLVAIGGVAHAQDIQPQVIQVADLDMSRPADVARFNLRVDQAARRICGAASDMTISSACREAVRAEATEKLDALHTQTAAAQTWTVAGN